MAAVTFLQVLTLPDTGKLFVTAALNNYLPSKYLTRIKIFDTQHIILEDNSKKEKHFFHLMKIPGIALMFTHYFVVTFGISARYVTFPVFLLHSVSVFM